MPTVRVLDHSDHDRVQAVSRLRTYAFHPETAAGGVPPDDTAGVTFITDTEGEVSAAASLLDLTTNVRGRVLSTAGVAAVVTRPEARRGGHAGALMRHLLVHAREQGYVVSALYPFRGSFYARFGYTALPVPHRVRLDVHQLAPLAAAAEVVDVRLLRPELDHADAAAFLRRFQRQRHGMVLPRVDSGVASGFTAAVRREREITALLTYQLDAYGGRLDARHLLAEGPADRTALLGWIARHDGQAQQAVLQLLPEQRPELWLPDLSVRYETRATYPDHPPPMTRILNVEALDGLQVGVGGVRLRVRDELLPDNDGCYGCHADEGRLVVTRGGDPQATVHVAGLTALVYGVTAPADLVQRGLLEADDATQRCLTALFPPLSPHTYLRF